MPAPQELMNNTLEFFQKNIVVIHGLNPVESNYQATTDFSLLESDSLFGAYTPGTRKSSVLKKTKAAEIYLVAPYNNNPATLITVYWLGYKDDSAKFQMLGTNGPRVMLTHRMDGCTFGVGSPTATGDVLVGHFNIQTVSGQADVGAMRDTAKVMLGDNAKLLEKTKYMKGNNQNITTTFGVRNNNNRWKFYHQRYRPDGLSYKLVDVRPI